MGDDLTYKVGSDEKTVKIPIQWMDITGSRGLPDTMVRHEVRIRARIGDGRPVSDFQASKHSLVDAGDPGTDAPERNDQWTPMHYAWRHNDANGWLDHSGLPWNKRHPGPSQDGDDHQPPPGSDDQNQFSPTSPGDDEEPDQNICLLYTSPSPRDATLSRMPSSA